MFLSSALVLNFSSKLKITKFWMPFLMHKFFKLFLKCSWMFYNILPEFIANQNKEKNNDTEKTKFHQS